MFFIIEVLKPSSKILGVQYPNTPNACYTEDHFNSRVVMYLLVGMNMHKDAYNVRTSLYKSMSMYTEPHNDLFQFNEFIPSNLPVKSVSNSSKISFSDPKRRTHRCHCFEGIPFCVWSQKRTTATNALLTLWNDYLFNQNST